MNFPRRVTSMVMAVVLLALGGCTALSDEASDLRIEGFSESQQRDFVKSLAELRAIPGVSEVSWVATPKSYWESFATIEVGVKEDFAEKQLSAVAATMSRYDGNGVGPDLPVSFAIRLGDDERAGFTVQGLSVPHDIVVQNYRYWREISAAIELDVTMDVQATFPGRDDYMRIISAPAETNPRQPLRHMIDHYDALTALTSSEGDSAGPLSAVGGGMIEFWSIPGVQLSGSLPPREVLDLADRLSALFSLRTNAWLTAEPDDGDRFPEGVSVRWASDRTSQQSRQVDLFFSDYREEDWPAIVAAAAATSPMEGFEFYYFSVDRDFSFHTSTCEGTVQKTADDQELFDAIQASGVTLLDGAAPGQCIPDFYE
ncbi:MAG: hypothetical protein ACSHW9_01865 [Salinibacterium amurskyense]